MALGLLSCAFAEQPAPSPVQLALAETVALGADDTLEFTLDLPEVPRDGTVAIPSVNVFLLRSADAAPAENDAGFGRTLIWPSPKPGQWLVHVRGLKAPQNQTGPCDLLVRWKVPQTGSAGLRAGGQFRLPGRVAFKAEAADAVLLMDGSLSMGRNDPQRLRVEAAREFIAAARRTGSVGRIAIIQFDDKTRLICGLTPLNESFEKALERINELGQTDIDGGIRHALKLLKEGSASQGSAAGGHILLLTDGKQEPGNYGNAHEEATKCGVAVHTLALGREADRPLLKRIAAETGGTYADAAKDRDLGLAYAAIASRIAAQRLVFSGNIAGSAGLRAGEAETPLPIDSSCRTLAISITGDGAGTLKILNPAGQSWQSPQQARPEFFTEVPEEGKWRAQWEGQQTSLSVTARTALYPVLYRTQLQPSAPLEIDADEPTLAISLCEADAPVSGATVQTTLRFTSAGDRTITAQLFDDGKHDDGAAGDGIYATFLPPLDPAGGAYPDNTTGTLQVVVTGKRGDADFRRETQSTFVVHRHNGPALLVQGPLDLGTHFAGEDVPAQVALRVRGSGGAFSVASSPPSLLGKGVGGVGSSGKGAGGVGLRVDVPPVPATLKPRENLSVPFKLLLPELAAPGTYSGTLECQLAGAPLLRVPWRIQIATPALQAPPEIDLGRLQPGDRAPAQLRLTSTGGTLTICGAEILPHSHRALSSLLLALGSKSPVAESKSQEPRAKSEELLDAIRPLRLTSPSTLALTCNPQGADLDIDLDLSADAPEGMLTRWLILRDIGGRELARVQIKCLVAPQHLLVEAPLDFGRVEPGDSLTRTIRWQWSQPGLRPPLNASIKLLPDPRCATVQTSLTPPALESAQSAIRNPQSALRPEPCASSTFSLTIPPQTPSGEIAGWIAIEAGPALMVHRWIATVITPRLAIDPTTLDFGSLIQGQKRKLFLTLKADGARAMPVAITQATPFAKVRIPKITLPSDALKLPDKPIEAVTLSAGDNPQSAIRNPQSTEPIPLTLEIPDSAQDGLYRTQLNVTSRLGTITLPVTVTVINEITPAPFHVSPSTLVLRFETRAKLPSDSARVISHRDDAIPLTMELVPVSTGLTEAEAEGKKQPACATFFDESAGDALHQSVSLPGRETIEVFLRARPDAQAGQRCRLLIRGVAPASVPANPASPEAGPIVEEQVVEVLIERATPFSIAPVSETPRVLNWILIALIVVLLAAALAIHRAVKRPWVRYAVYSMLIHLGLLPWAMPRTQLMTFLPDSVQVSLLESEESLGGALSEQQMRRLEALRSGTGDEVVKLATSNGIGGMGGDGKLPDLAATDVKTAGAPAATTLEAAPPQESRPQPPPGALSGRAPSAPEADAPLGTDALPAAGAPAPAPAPAPPGPTLAKTNFPAARNDAPLPEPAPSGQTPAMVFDTELPTVGQAISLPAQANSPRHDAGAARPLGMPAIDDAPLAIEPPPPAHASATVAAPVSTDRNVGATAPVPAGVPIPTAPPTLPPGAELGGGTAAPGPRAAPTEDLARSGASTSVLTGTGTDKSSASGLALSSRVASGVNDSAIDDPLDFGKAVGGASNNPNAPDTPTGGKAAAGGTSPGVARGGSALGSGNGMSATQGLGQGGGDPLAGLGAGGAGIAMSGRSGGTGNLPATSIAGGNGTGAGSIGPGGTGAGAVRRPGAFGLGGEGDEPLAGGLVGGPGGVAPASVPAGSGTPNGKGTGPGVPGGTGLTARGGSALGQLSGTGSAGLRAGSGGLDLAQGIGTGTGVGNGASPGRGGPKLPTVSLGEGTGAGTGNGPGGTGTARRPGGTGAGDGDAPLAIGPVAPASVPAGAGTGVPGGTPGGKGIGPGVIGGTGQPTRGVTALGGFGNGGGSAGLRAGSGGLDLTGGLGFTGGSGLGTGHKPSKIAGLDLGGIPGGSGVGLDGTGTGGSHKKFGTGPGGDGDDPLALGLPPSASNGTGTGRGPGVPKGRDGHGAGEGGTGLPGFGAGGTRVSAVTGGFGRGGAAGSGSGTGASGIGTGTLSGIGDGRTQAVQPKSAALDSGPNSLELESQGGGRRGSELGTGNLRDWRVLKGQASGGLVRLNMALAKHSGDWNSSPTALHFLRSVFIERSGLPELEVNVANLDLTDLKNMQRCSIILITSNLPIDFKPAELDCLRKYVEGGGTLWVNDSSASDYEKFDLAFRPVVPQIVPGAELTMLPMDHPLFNSCYDLTKGFKSFRVPPGDKYRVNYIEGVLVPDPNAGEFGRRAGIIYTRNDYADGLEIDPRMQAGMKSLTDLTAAEMQESSLRFGMNLLAYALGSNAPKLPPPADSEAQFEKIYRYNGPALPALDDYTVDLDKWNKPIWRAEADWCNPTEMWLLPDVHEKTKVLSVRFTGGEKFKAAVARLLDTDLSAAQALVFDAYSDLKSGANVSLLFNCKNDRAFESRPVFVRPGWNRNLRFPLNLGDLKSNASKEPWKNHDTPFEPRNEIERITILIYNLSDSGAMKLGPIRKQPQ
jgi:hypothetical protein